MDTLYILMTITLMNTGVSGVQYSPELSLKEATVAYTKATSNNNIMASLTYVEAQLIKVYHPKKK